MPYRRSIRLKGYDYSQRGAYFVTVCVNKRECLLGDISDEGIMHFNKNGEIVQETWIDLPKHYSHVTLDAFALMPNHMHGILFFSEQNIYLNTKSGEGVFPGVGIESDGEISVGAGFKPAPTSEMSPIAINIVGAGFKPAPTENQMAGGRKTRQGLPEIVRGLKTFSSRRINTLCSTQGARFWQRNYYEHVIRDDEELNQIRQYIMDNPKKWTEDEENPINLKPI